MSADVDDRLSCMVNPAETSTSLLSAMVRDVLDRNRYIVLGTIDRDGHPRVSPVYFTSHRYRDLYWVSHPDSHHSINLTRDQRVTGVVYDSTQPPTGSAQAVYVDGVATEIPADVLSDHWPVAFDPGRGGRAFAAHELTGSADLRLWMLRIGSWEVHIGAGHPTLGTGRDRRVPANVH